MSQYGEENVLNILELMDRIYNNENLMIKITTDLDSICYKCNCQRREKDPGDSCDGRIFRSWDSRVAYHGGFNIGKIYTSKKLKEKLIEKNLERNN
jgi:hypothetical protein